MWNLYLKDNNGVAIKSTCSRLKKSLNKTDFDVNIGMVRYIDYDSDEFYDKQEFRHKFYNTTIPFIHKRKFFKFENEYRAIIRLPDPEGEVAFNSFEKLWGNEKDENGKLIQVELSALLEQIVIAPGASSSIRKEVERLLNESNLQIPIVESKMNDRPLF